MRHVRHTIADPGDQGALDLARGLVPAGAERIHRFSPHGLSVSRVGTAGTVAVHTWPERGVATVDAYGAAVDLLEPTPSEDPCPS